MGFILNSDKEPVRLKLKRDRTRSLKQGYPWIYKDWLADLPKAPAGSRVMVKDKDGSLIAFGMYDPESPIAVRVLAVESERLDDDLIATRLEAALALRRSSFSSATTGFRLINGEGDGLPGLVCDVYGKTVVIKLDGDGPTGFWNVDEVAGWMRSRVNAESVFLKHRADAPTRGVPILGALPSEPVQFVENGVKFRADVVQGQKTGFFFDQRENRDRIRGMASGRKVLNLFGYTGGFSIYAGVGGAKAVTTVDIAKPAVEAACQNWSLNQLPQGAHEGVAVDAFEFIEDAKRNKQRWDLIIVDPPSFAPAERLVEKAKESYEALFVGALQVLDDGGIAALSSCSSHIPPSMFMEICQAASSKARKRARVLGIYGQPADHPFPLVCTELQYLKFVLLGSY